MSCFVPSEGFSPDIHISCGNGRLNILSRPYYFFLSHCPERNTRCLEYIRGKHASSQQAHSTIEQLENDLSEDLERRHTLHMEIAEILKNIVDFATEDGVEHDKVQTCTCSPFRFI